MLHFSLYFQIHDNSKALLWSKGLTGMFNCLVGLEAQYWPEPSSVLLLSMYVSREGSGGGSGKAAGLYWLA